MLIEAFGSRCSERLPALLLVDSHCTGRPAFDSLAVWRPPSVPCTISCSWLCFTIGFSASIAAHTRSYCFRIVANACREIAQLRSLCTRWTLPSRALVCDTRTHQHVRLRRQAPVDATPRSIASPAYRASWRLLASSLRRVKVRGDSSAVSCAPATRSSASAISTLLYDLECRVPFSFPHCFGPVRPGCNEDIADRVRLMKRPAAICTRLLG